MLKTYLRKILDFTLWLFAPEFVWRGVNYCAQPSRFWRNKQTYPRYIVCLMDDSRYYRRFDGTYRDSAGVMLPLYIASSVGMGDRLPFHRADPTFEARGIWWQDRVVKPRITWFGANQDMVVTDWFQN